MPGELDEFGIPIKKSVSLEQSVDEFGIPLKKKEPSSGSLLSGSDSSSGASKSEILDSGLPKFNFEGDRAPMGVTEDQSNLLRAAPSTAETTPKDVTNFSPEIQKTGLLMNDKAESFLRGTARLGNSVLKTPGFIYDVASSATNRVINKPLGIADAPSSEEIGKATGLNGVTSDLDKAIENSTKTFQEKYDKGVSDYFKKGEYGKGFDVLSNAVLESAPTTIALMLGNASGLSTAGSVGAGGLVFGADKMSRLEKENPDMSHEQKTTAALANGLLEGAFEQFGLTKLGSVTASVLKNEGAEAAKKIAEEGFKKTYGKILARYLGTSAEEALSEGATQFAQNAIDKYSGAKPDLDLRDGVVDATIIGLGAGSSMAAPTTALSFAKTKSAVQRASEIEKHKAVLEEQLQNPDVSEDVKPAISNRIKDLNAEDAAIASEEKQKYNQLPDDKKTEVDNLLKKANDIAASATDETISKDAREIFKRDIDNIDEKIDEIYKEAEKEREQAAKEKGLEKPEKPSATEGAKVALTTEAAPVESTETPATETGLIEGEKKSEPIDLTNVETASQITETPTTENKSPLQEAKEVEAAPQSEEPVISKEEPESKVSGIKKALVSDEIINSVDLEKISEKEFHEKAKQIIDTGEVKPEEVVSEVLKKHRALQPKEVVALIYHKTQIDNDIRDAYKERNNLEKEGESTEVIDSKISDLEQKRMDFEQVSVITANQQSLAFRLRKGLRDSAFNLVNEISKYKAANNGEIPAEVEEKMRDLDKRYREASEKIVELEKQVEENEIDKAHRNIIEDIDREKNVGKNKTYSQKSKELADKVRKLKGKPFTFTTRDGKEVPIQKQGLGMDAIIEIAARTIETTGKIADGIAAVIKQVKDQDWYKSLSKEEKDDFSKQLTDHFGEDEKQVAKAHINEDGKLIIPHSLIREIYKSGKTDIKEIVDEVKKQINVEGVTDRQVRDAITRYGKTVNLNKEEIETGIRQAKRIGKLISQLEDIQNEERPKRTGLQRDKPSDEERRLMKEVKREMKNLPEDPEEDARLMKSALEATKTRLKNRIKDLENQLATGEKTPKSKGVELDAEAKELKEKVEKLRTELEAIEGKPKISDEQRLARMKTYTQNKIKELEAKIKNRDFSKTEKRKPISDTELTKARGELAEMKDEFEKIQYENELKNRTKWEKARHMMMGALNIPRAFKLGFDLSAIGVQGLRRLSTSPLQSAKAFKDMMGQVFSEKAQKEWLKTLKGQDFYPTLKAAGAAFTELDGKISVREENFSNDLVKHAFKFVFNEKLGLDKINPYEASNRAFSGYLNSIRLQGYMEGFKALESKGRTFESHPQDYKSWVKYINNITGRGSLGKRGNSSELAQFVFTSPRKMISELNLINPHFWGNIVKKDTGKDYDYQLTPTVARKAFADFSMGLGITALAATLARAAFADDDDKKDKDFTDPRSSNFMGVKIRDEHGGFTVVHPFASYKTEAVLIARLLSGEMTNTRTGKTSPLGKQPMTRGTELITSFLSNKLSPTVQMGWKKLKQGEKYDAKEEALKIIQPAAIEGFLQTYKDYPVETETMLTILAFLGLSETHIEKKK